MNIDWTFVIGTALLIVLSVVAVADFLQGGPMWPCLVVSIGIQAAALWWHRERAQAGA